MKGTEKQIAWAEDIKASYKKQIEEVKDYYKGIIETGTLDGKCSAGAMAFVSAYHSDAVYRRVSEEMRSSEIFAVYHAATDKAEKHEAALALRRATAKEALSRLEKESAEMLGHDDAAWWINHRMH